MFDLVDQIVTEHVRPRDAGGVGARLGQAGIGSCRRGTRRLATILDPEFGVSEGTLLACLRVRRCPVADICGECRPQVGDRFIISGSELVNDPAGVESLVHSTRLKRGTALCKWRGA